METATATLDARRARIPIALAAGEALSPPGGAGRQLLVLRKGWAARCHRLSDGRRQISALFVAGDLCDPLWLAGTPHHTVEALTAIEAVPIAESELQPRGEGPADLVRELAADVGHAASWTVSLGRKSALERIAHLFCDLLVRLGRSTAVGRSCPLPLSHDDIADATGLTAQHVQRLLADLSGAGLARVARHKLSVPDFARLARTARFDLADVPRRPDWLARV
ncbi:Crp/Fnr family transcriptional regulator [Novosphingobium huizhouense]|uniref:Crp/Fnr family transcriptional regulator n=1 Tax=Novosphingobium huizhouense TaxID=2866625 RepID=UPI001CD85D39|nr:Crp/Fnr family transcriptional regulator [Novosphingobium huizhouense]